MSIPVIGEIAQAWRFANFSSFFVIGSKLEIALMKDEAAQKRTTRQASFTNARLYFADSKNSIDFIHSVIR